MRDIFKSMLTVRCSYISDFDIFESTSPSTASFQMLNLVLGLMRPPRKPSLQLCRTVMASWRKARVWHVYSSIFPKRSIPLILDSFARVGVNEDLLSWTKDYLSDCSQQVVLRGISPPTAGISSGVPQGSILGPLLFILAIDSIAAVSISVLGRVSMFADDICYFRPIVSEEDLLAVQLDVDLIHNWISSRMLRLNDEVYGVI